jgi:hypothetical protein
MRYIAFSSVENQRVTKKVKIKKSLLENLYSFAVSPIVDICFTPSSIEARKKNPAILDRNTRKVCGRIVKLSIMMRERIVPKKISV